MFAFPREFEKKTKKNKWKGECWASQRNYYWSKIAYISANDYVDYLSVPLSCLTKSQMRENLVEMVHVEDNIVITDAQLK